MTVIDRETASTPGVDASLSVQVGETIRERIIRGHYPQGGRLIEAKLAAELEVSRIPLRSAIPQLEVDGFIRTLPRRGAVVFHWTEQAVNDLFDVRLALEVAATGHAALAVEQGRSLAPLLAAIDESHRALDSGDAFRVAGASTLIHQSVVELAGNDLLTSLMRAVSGRITWLFYLTSQRDADLACEQHHALSDVIATGNKALAEATAFAHIELGRKPSLEAMASIISERI
ncbi:GntR family transcriptional regulator [Frondihabitans sucicola]|uniref:GntR family transcriptional regulator n=1 Tax=Frondihabitans sucicola TaxID=1268041 RepID=A0ABM8GSA8_9MICO|nr:GntR family transcriptional regulator [Frondihabitans sucicola]BDZ51342.1 GntR family transcriptional regulator [Frondihabitans sucicola]